MTDTDIIYVNIPCPTKKEAVNLCRQLLEKDLCGTAKIYDHVHLMYTENGVQGEDVVIISLKTTQANLQEIHAFILKNHSWGTPCIEVLPVINDMC